MVLPLFLILVFSALNILRHFLQNFLFPIFTWFLWAILNASSTYLVDSFSFLVFLASCSSLSISSLASCFDTLKL